MKQKISSLTHPSFCAKTLISLLTLACLNFGCGGEEKPAATAEPGAPMPTDTIAQTGTDSATVSAPIKLEPVSGPTVTKKLDCGVTVKVRESGMERQLLTILEDKSSKLDKEAWIDFDQIAFEPGKPNLIMASSANQMMTLAKIQLCFPKARIKIGINPKNSAGKGAYTKLAAERIFVVKATLLGLGVPELNLSNETFKIQNPSAASDDGKTHHLAIQVLAK